MLWHESHRVSLNPLDAQICNRVYESFKRRHSRLFVYPIPTYVAPSLLVTTLLVNTFGEAQRKELTPRILFYTGIDGRDLYSDIGVGADCVRVCETFGFVRLDSQGLPLEGSHLSSAMSLVVTGHCVLPRETAYKPDIIVFDSNGFDADSLVELLAMALKRWPKVLIYGVTANPLTPFIEMASHRNWDISDLLREVPAISHVTRVRDPFDRVASQLERRANGIHYRLNTVAEDPASSWHELRDLTDLAKRNTAKLSTARQLLGLIKWLCALPILPSEFESFRSANMTSFRERLATLRDTARHEGGNAGLLAGGAALLQDIANQLEARNSKRESLLEAILECCYAEKSVVVLVQKPGMRSVLQQAVQLIPEFIDMLEDGRLSFASVGQLAKASTCDVVIVPGILQSRSIWALRAENGSDMLFLAYGVERFLLEWCLREVGVLALNEWLSSGQNYSIEGVSDELGTANPIPEAVDVSAPPDAFMLDIATLMAEDDDSESQQPQASTPTFGPRRTLHFEDGSTLTVADSTSILVIQELDEPIVSKLARRVDAGDVILLINGGVQESLFELLRERVDAQTTLSRAIEIVKAFQRALASGVNRSEDLGSTLTQRVQNLHLALLSCGSRIQHPLSVEQWVSGKAFGPSDPDDIVRLGTVLSIDLFSDRPRDFYRAMQTVRVAHRELGKILVRAIKNLFKERDTKSIKITVDNEDVILYDIVDAVSLKRIIHIDGVCE